MQRSKDADAHNPSEILVHRGVCILNGWPTSYKSFKTYNLSMQNSYCDHRNFDNVNQALNLYSYRNTLRHKVQYIRPVTNIDFNLCNAAI
jgi:hypothetical protein